MIGFLKPTPAERRMLDLKPLRGPTPWLVAIMTFSICLVAAAGLGLASTARLMAGAVEQRYSLEVPAANARLDALTAAVRATPGVSRVDPVSEAAMRNGLRRWLGALADSRDLPVPALINFDLADPAALPALERRVRALDPAATITAYRGAVGPVLDSLRTLVAVALALALLLAAAAAAAIVLAARADLDTHRPTIDILHDIGATDRQIATLFQRKISIDALTGGTLGAAAAALVLLLLAAGSAYLGELTGGATLGLLDLIVLALIPLLLAALASLVARAAVLGRLRQAP
jgi:cell division transport system permease protein